MSDFRQGQLVAVKVYSDENWEPAIFERKEGIFCICRSLLNRDAWLRRPWPKAKPAEEVWPSIFIGADREIIDSLQKERERLHQAIGWLCDRLEEASREHHVCPPNALPEDCDNACWECWQQAVYEAMEGADGAE